MAKQKKVVSIEDEFGGNAAVAAAEPGDTTTQVEDEVVAPEAPEAPPKETEEQVEEQDEGTAKPKAKSWKDLGLVGFEGKTDEEIAKAILEERARAGSEQRDHDFRRRVFGEQADELGELRKFKKEHEEKAAQSAKTDPLDLLPDMTDGEIVDFNKIYETNPVKAVLKYASPHLKKIISEQINSALTEQIGEAIGESMAAERTNLEFNDFRSKNEDAETYWPFMRTLDDERYLGKQSRPFSELYELAKLGPYAEGTVVNPLYEPTYLLMAKYPNMTFKEAHSFAKQQASSPEAAEKKRAALEKDITKIDSVNTASAVTQKSKGTGKIVTIEDEFGV